MEALGRLESAADKADAAATRLQIATADSARDAAADEAKALALGARGAAAGLREDLAAAAGADDAAAAAAATAAVAAAAAAVDAELRDVAAELDAAAGAGGAGGSGSATNANRPAFARAPTFKSSARAVRELEALAARRGARSVRAASVAAAWALWAALVIGIIRRFALGGPELHRALAWGAAWGFLATAFYFFNRKRKAERAQRLAMVPGAKGVQALLHHVPSWLAFGPLERVEWLNRLLAKAWPYYDAAICAEVKAQLEPLFESAKPGFIKKLFFAKLTMGDAPFRVEGIRVAAGEFAPGGAEGIELDVDFRWASDASIFLAIELPAGGAATRMVPKVADIAVSGTLRVILSPLLPEIPGFGAATVSLMRPPVVKFRLDFGAAFGGSYSAKAVQAWLDPFLRSTVAGMLVWPRRVVVPILGEEATGSLTPLYLRNKGALQLDVVEARGLPKMDRVGTADPYVEAYTTSTVVEETSVKKNTLAPKWGERLWLLVQEPSTQAAYLTVNDVDLVNVKELMRVNVLKGAASVFNAKDLIGRAALRVADLAAAPGVERDLWLPLGLGEFSDEDGCGGGRGELRVRATYWPLEAMGGHAEARLGALIVTLERADDLAAADLPVFSSDPYAVFTFGGAKEKPRTSPTVYSTLAPRWADAKFEWFRVSPKETSLKIAVWDYDALSRDELLGEAEVDVYADVACAPGGDVTKTIALKNVPREWLRAAGPAPKPSTVTLRLQWIPFAGV